MQNNFMLFSELQKQLSPSPIKTWRLLKQLRDESRMKEPDDFIMQDRKLFVNVPRFIVELEELGYANLKSNDFKNSDMKSDDIMKLAEELKLISSEITESRIQEEMKSDDFTADNFKPHFVAEDHSMKSTTQNLKSDEINNSTANTNLKSNEISDVQREIIAAKNEVIDTLKGSVRSKDEDVIQLRAVISELTDQLKTTTRQNAWLTNLLVAPKTESEPARSAKVTDISDFTDDFTEDEDTHHEAIPEEDTPGEARHNNEKSDEIFTNDEEQSAS